MKTLITLSIAFFISLGAFFSDLKAIDKGLPVCNVSGCSTTHAINDTLIHASVGSQMQNFFQNLFTTSNWPPRWNCGTWSDFHGWLYILSDISIWGAYFAIPFVLGLFFIRRRKTGLPYPGILVLFILFIFSCGLTHLIDALIFWVPVYNFSAFIRFLTAVVSVGTVFALVKVAPEAIKFKSPKELEKIIQERTNELEAANEELASANEEFIAINEELGTVNNQLAEQIREKEKARSEINIVLESIPQIAWTTNSEGKLAYVNNQWWVYTGLEKTSYTPDWNIVFHPDDIEIVKSNWATSIIEGQEFIAEGRLRSSTGNYEWFLMKGVPVKDSLGNIEKWIGTFTNIHNQKLDLQRKDTFLNIASHELKTPLTIVRAYSELIANNDLINKEEDLKTYSLKVETHIQKLENLINELLDVSRIGTDKMSYDLQKENFAHIIEECVSDFNNIKNTNHDITIVGNAEQEVMCDKSKINQVIHNLLNNAVKYSKDNNLIKISLSQDKNKVYCSIQDYGVGIPNEEVENIFKRFYRSTNNRVAGGLGLGLYISDEIIKHHKGEITVKSIEGEGSTFTISLPVIV